jgi:hypothetical protein
MTSPSDHCGLRTHRECACPADRCHQQPPTHAPVSSPSLGVTFSAAIVCGAIIAFIVFVSVPSAKAEFHRQALEQQEISHHG